MMRSNQPEFRDLDRQEIDDLLSRNHLGRIAYVARHHVDLQPISYVYEAPWIYVRTSPGAKVDALMHFQWVAFEVDEADDIFNWRSVVVHGAAYLLDPSTTRPADYQKALDAVRQNIPQTFTSEDPVPERGELLRIHVDRVRGRMAWTPQAFQRKD